MVRESPFKGKPVWQRVWRALHHSLDGFREAYKCEDAFRQEALLAAILIPLSFFLPVSGVGRALMIASVLLVLIVELVNSAIEATGAVTRRQEVALNFGICNWNEVHILCAYC